MFHQAIHTGIAIQVSFSILCSFSTSLNFVCSNWFENLDMIKTSLKLDELLRRSVAFLMKPRHYPNLADCENVPSRLIIKVMLDFVLSKSVCKAEHVSI